MTLPEEAIQRFAAAVRARESGGDDGAAYATVNRWGYLGAYQFGMARLCDLGLTERRPGHRGYGNVAFRWRHPYDQARFLADRDLQDRTFRAHVTDHLRWLERRGYLSSCGVMLSTLLRDGLAPGDDDAPVTVYGLLGVCHLLGRGGVRALIREGVDLADGLGTRASDYIREFAPLASNAS